jgi:acyl CoA:acetate/3-ketoacid CoA transferase alpha subunit
MGEWISRRGAEGEDTGGVKKSKCVLRIYTHIRKRHNETLKKGEKGLREYKGGNLMQSVQCASMELSQCVLVLEMHSNFKNWKKEPSEIPSS